MTEEIRKKIRENEFIKNYLRENSHHYKYLYRDSNYIKKIESLAKEAYKQRAIDKLEQLEKRINLFQTIMSTLK